MAEVEAAMEVIAEVEVREEEEQLSIADDGQLEGEEEQLKKAMKVVLKDPLLLITFLSGDKALRLSLQSALAVFGPKPHMAPSLRKVANVVGEATCPCCNNIFTSGLGYEKHMYKTHIREGDKDLRSYFPLEIQRQRSATRMPQQET